MQRGSGWRAAAPYTSSEYNWGAPGYLPARYWLDISFVYRGLPVNGFNLMSGKFQRVPDYLSFLYTWTVGAYGIKFEVRILWQPSPNGPYWAAGLRIDDGKGGMVEEILIADAAIAPLDVNGWQYYHSQSLKITGLDFGVGRPAWDCYPVSYDEEPH